MRFVASSTCAAVLVVGLQAATVSPELSRLSRAHAESDDRDARARLAEYASRAAGDERAWARFALGMGDHLHERWEDSARELAAVPKNFEFADYAAFHGGRALAKAENFEQAAAALAAFAADFPDSRFARDAAQVRIESVIRLERLDEARKLVQPRATAASEYVQLYYLGRVLDLTGESLEAVKAYRRVYYHYPLSRFASMAEDHLNALRQRLGSRYPEAPSAWRLARADVLFDAGRFGDAADEYRRAWGGLSGTERDRARLRFGVANYRRLHTATAYQWLSNLQPADPELDAERLYYLGECARRKRLVAEFEGTAAELAREHPKSPWLQQAYFSLGNYYLLENRPEKYVGYYERAARVDRSTDLSATAHWKVCWRAYLDEDPRARSLLEEHLRLYSGSQQASNALYWLGRVLEKQGDEASARALYAEIVERFPHYYYAYMASRRLAESGAPATPPPAEYRPVLAELSPPRRLDAAPSPRAGRLIERAAALNALGLVEFAERELTTFDYRAPDAHWVGLELARAAADRDDHFRGLRHMKRYGFGYLRFPIESMDREFWTRLYPLPWSARLRARAAAHGLDPYLVAGLIRQESEFNPRAVSRAGAIGLMQLMPRTGQGLARRLGLGYSSAKLRDPDFSLRLGTFHFNQVLEQFNGDLELALAAYNAGERRAEEWLTWANFDEPGEFVETIPFTETRGYVQAVLRNREVYRMLYGGPAEAPPPTRAAVAAGDGNE